MPYSSNSVATTINAWAIRLPYTLRRVEAEDDVKPVWEDRPFEEYPHDYANLRQMVYIGRNGFPRHPIFGLRERGDGSTFALTTILDFHATQL